MGNKNTKANTNISEKRYNIKLIGKINKENNSYLIKRIKRGKFSNIKIGSTNSLNEIIIIKRENEKIILNLIIDTINLNNNASKVDCIILEFDINDNKSFEDIKSYWNNEGKYNKKTNLIYLICFGKDSHLKNNGIYDNAIKFAESFNMKFLFVPDKNNNKIEEFFNELLENLEREKKINEEKIKEIIRTDYEFKIVFVGECGIGAKTSLINEILHEGSRLKLHESYDSENSLFRKKIIYLDNGKKITLNLVDTVGQEVMRSLTKLYIKRCDCAVLGYDITNKESFEELKKFWYPTVKEETDLIYLIGNKFDLLLRESVREDEARLFANDNNLRFFLTSCLNGYGIKSFIDDLVDELLFSYKK